MYLFRLHVKPDGGTASRNDIFKYCREQGILGVGWRLNSITQTKNWDEFLAEAKGLYPNLNQCAYIKGMVTEGSLVWTRDLKGTYYLARVISGWEYFTTEESRDKNIDIGNIFRVSFQELSIAEVPGKVVSSFAPSKTMQRILDPTSMVYSKFLWNKLTKSTTYEIDQAIADAPDVFSLLDSEEVEDLVFLYLQTKGWFVIPNSRKADTIAFEYQVVRPDDGVIAQVQVKTGKERININKYNDTASLVKLFQSNELYDGKQSNKVECLSRHEVEKFLSDSICWLPARYRHKMQMLRNTNGTSNRQYSSSA